MEEVEEEGEEEVEEEVEEVEKEVEEEGEEEKGIEWCICACSWAMKCRRGRQRGGDAAAMETARRSMSTRSRKTSKQRPKLQLG